MTSKLLQTTFNKFQSDILFCITPTSWKTLSGHFQKFRFLYLGLKVVKGNKRKSFVHSSQSCMNNIIKIIPCVEGDRSDCQPEASSVARSRRLRAVVVVEGRQSDLSPSTQSIIFMILFLSHRKSSFTHLVYLCTLGPFVKRKE